MRVKSVLRQIMMLCMLLGVMTCTAVAADDFAFSDISNTEYASAIEWAAENGVVNGTGDGKFSPQSPVTYQQFMSMYLALFFPEAYEGRDASLGWSDSIMQSAEQAGIITKYEVKNPPQCTWLEITDKLFEATGLQIYDRTLWGMEPESENGLNIPETNLVISAAAYHLYDGIDINDWKSTPTRAETVQMLYQAATRNHEEELPEIVKSFSVKFEGTQKTIPSTVYLALSDVPKKYLDQFVKQGWTMYVVDSDISTVHPEYKNFAENAAGLTDPNRHEVYIRSNSSGLSNTVRHEMGHFAALITQKCLPQTYYQKEKDALTTLLRKYADKSRDEMFAETFAYIAKNKNSQEAIEQLQAVAPETYTFVFENFFK